MSFNEIETRLAEIEEKIGSRELGWEDEYRKKLLTEVDQRIRVRWGAIILACTTLVIMYLFALVGFQAVTSSSATGGALSALKVGLFVAPIVSMTTVMVVLLIGAFKRHSDENDKVDLPELITQAVKAFQQT